MTTRERITSERNETRDKIEKLEKKIEEFPDKEEELNPQLDALRIRKSDLDRDIAVLEANPENPDNTVEVLVKDKIKAYRNAEKASIIGDTVGDPMKDTSGPSLNILIKLSSIISVVFGTLFVNTSYLLK